MLSCCNHCFLTVFLSFSHSTLLGYQMLQGATMQQLQQVQVQSQGTPITVNTHAYMHLCTCNSHTDTPTQAQTRTHTHGPKLMSAGLLIRLLLRAAVRLGSLTLIKVTADGDQMVFSKYCDRREELLGHLLSIPCLPAWLIAKPGRYDLRMTQRCAVNLSFMEVSYFPNFVCINSKPLPALQLLLLFPVLVCSLSPFLCTDV